MPTQKSKESPIRNFFSSFFNSTEKKQKRQANEELKEKLVNEDDERSFDTDNESGQNTDIGDNSSNDSDYTPPSFK